MIWQAWRTTQNFIAGVLITLVLVGNCSGTALAQQSNAPLLIEVDVRSSINRSGGPIPLTVHINYFGSKSGVAGDLMFRLVATDGTPMATYRFDGLYLTQGDQTFDYLIQPPTSGIWQEAFDIYPSFVTSTGETYNFLEQLLRIPGAGRRACVITIATLTDDVLADRDKEMSADLAFESRMPDMRRTQPNQRPAMTLFRGLNVLNFPNQPLEHCVSDMVLLPGETYSRLSERQVLCLLAWVRAGGSLGILLSENKRLNGDRAELLNRFLTNDTKDPLVYQTSEGEVHFARNNEQPVLSRHCGLGRVVVGTETGPASLRERWGDELLQQVYIHLWKVSAEQARYIKKSPTGSWSWEPGKRNTILHNLNFQRMDDPGLENFVRRFRSTPTLGGNSLLQETLPQGMEMIPLWLMGVTLFLYILVIGPLDYILLGTLNLRKYTWLTFPMVTVLFTAGAIWVANLKMQGSSDSGSVLIRDITDSGLIVRENEIVTFVPMTNQVRSVEARRELLTPIHPSRLSVDGQSSMPMLRDQLDDQPDYRGRFPAEAQLVQRVYKWSPEMVRKVRIPLDPIREASGFDWDKPVNPRDRATHLDLTRRIQAAFGSDVHAELIRHDGQVSDSNQFKPPPEELLDRIHLCGRGDLFESTYDEIYTNRNFATSARNYGYPQYEQVSFLRSSSLREEAGMYSVVSQLSPKCDDFLEDLPILDSTDDSTWLLLITVQAGNRWEIYRKLINTKSM